MEGHNLRSRGRPSDCCRIGDLGGHGPESEISLLSPTLVFDESAVALRCARDFRTSSQRPLLMGG